MIHEITLKWDGRVDEFLDVISNRHSLLLDQRHEIQSAESEQDVESKYEFTDLMHYDYYQAIDKKIKKLNDEMNNTSNNIVKLDEFNKVLNKKLLSKIPVTLKGTSSSNNPLSSQWKSISKFSIGYRFAYIHVQPEHRISQYAFLGLQNYYDEESNEYFSDRLLDKFLNVLGLSYLNISNRSSYFNLNVSNSTTLKSMSPAALSINNISGYLKRIRFNHNYSLQNYRDEKEKLSFEIKVTFNDETDTVLFEVIDIQGQWILEDNILNGEISAFKGRQVLFQFFASNDEDNRLASDTYFYF